MNAETVTMLWFIAKYAGFILAVVLGSVALIALFGAKDIVSKIQDCDANDEPIDWSVTPGKPSECILSMPSVVKMRLAGWVFDYSKATQFVGASHPDGGKMSIAEVLPSYKGAVDPDDEIGEAIAAMLNCAMPTRATEEQLDFEGFVLSQKGKTP